MLTFLNLFAFVNGPKKFLLHQRGTIVEKLTEETLRDWSHLKELLSICEGKAFYKSLFFIPCLLQLLLCNLVYCCSPKTDRRDLIE